MPAPSLFLALFTQFPSEANSQKFAGAGPVDDWLLFVGFTLRFEQTVAIQWGEEDKDMTKDPRVVLDGLVFPEVPRWRDGQLWFCDFQLWLPDATGQVMVLDEAGTARTVVEEMPSGPPSGLGWLPDGRLLLVAAEGHSLLTLEPDGTLARHADLSEVTTHWCNELVVDASGRAYVGSCEPPPAAPTPTEMIVVHPDG